MKVGLNILFRENSWVDISQCCACCILNNYMCTRACKCSRWTYMYMYVTWLAMGLSMQEQREFLWWVWCKQFCLPVPFLGCKCVGTSSLPACYTPCSSLEVAQLS